MIDLSIVIVNYNVKHFISQCITSIIKEGSVHCSYEVIVVDNASTDDSFPFLEEKFGDKVTFLKNNQNLGFGKACNIGFSSTQGRFVLFLNPDTLVPVQALDKCVEILKDKKFEKVSALGVKLVDGSGSFLPESKRSFPTVWNSFCKLSGLATFFPDSKVFGRYNLTYLSEDSVNFVDALCGAFLMIRRESFQQINGFDPDYFMYGEDLDLCRRLIESGGQVLYYPKVNIVHFKGESHKEKNFQYYSRFYQAMNIYAGKHFSLFTSILIKVAILIAGVLSFLGDKFKVHLTKVLDLLALLGLIYLVKNLWATYVYKNSNYYDNNFLIYGIIFPIVMLSTLIVSKFYSKRSSFRNTFFGFLIGGIVSLAVYALFPESWRYSRSILLIFLLIAPLLLWFLRISIYTFLKINANQESRARRVAFVGNSIAYEKFVDWSKFLDRPLEIVGNVNNEGNNCLGSLDSLAEIITSYSLDEVVFDNNYADFDYIYIAMAKSGRNVQFKISGDRDMGIIGSNNARLAGDVYLLDFNYKINENSSKILKRCLDVTIALLILITFIFWIFYRKELLHNAIDIIVKGKTWVGYAAGESDELVLPLLRPSIISIDRYDPNFENADHHNFHLNLRYAKNYSIFVDLELVFKYIFR